MRPSYQGRADVVAPTTDQTWRDNSASPWLAVRIVRSPEVYPPLVSSSEPDAWDGARQGVGRKVPMLQKGQADRFHVVPF